MASAPLTCTDATVDVALSLKRLLDAQLLDVIVDVLKSRTEVASAVVEALVPKVAYAPTTVLTERRAHGTIKSLNSLSGYGFIDCPELHRDFGCDVFLRRSRARGRALRVAQKVHFAVLTNAKRKPEAFDVEHDIEPTDGVVISGLATSLESTLVLDHSAREKARIVVLAGREQASRKCNQCLLLIQHCICDGLASLRAEASALTNTTNVRFVVWMHVSEKTRASNTGKLLPKIMEGSEVLVHNLDEDTRRFQQILATAGDGTAFVLFPSSSAISAREVVFQGSVAGGSSQAGGESSHRKREVVVVLVDGTWTQARRMQASSVLSHLPCVTLCSDNIQHQSNFQWRKQSQEGRICTVEAAALLLEELGQSATGAILRRGLDELNIGLQRHRCM